MDEITGLEKICSIYIGLIEVCDLVPKQEKNYTDTIMTLSAILNKLSKNILNSIDK